MRVLALDLSTHAGYAVLDGERGTKPKLFVSGVLNLGKNVVEFGPYPWNYLHAAQEQLRQVLELYEVYRPGVVVVEEINLGRDRYVQKLLDFLHCKLLDCLDGEDVPVVYISSDGHDGWRTNIGLVMSKDQKKLNAKLSKAKREARDDGVKLDKTKLGIKGKVTKKHLAVARANAEYGLQLKQKDNDEADAILLGLAYFNHAVPCDGV